MAQFYKGQRNSERDSWTMHSEPQDLLAHPLIRSIQHYCNVREQHDYENVPSDSRENSVRLPSHPVVSDRAGNGAGYSDAHRSV